MVEAGSSLETSAEYTFGLQSGLCLAPQQRAQATEILAAVLGVAEERRDSEEGEEQQKYHSNRTEGYRLTVLTGFALCQLEDKV